MTNNQKQAISILNTLKDTEMVISEEEYYLLMDFIIPDKRSKRDMEDSPILNLLLEDSNLSVRARSCLKSIDVKTVRDLIKCSRKDLERIRCLGKHTLAEIEDFLTDNGLELERG